jgi:hypothetical protein
MRYDLRWLVVTAGNLAFLFGVGQANHCLAALDFGWLRGPFHLFLLGLPVAFAALRLRLVQGLAAVVPTALAFEAALPARPGFFVIACSACFCIALALRGSVSRFAPARALAASLLVNLALVAAISIHAISAGGAASVARIVTDLLASQAVLVLLTGWFFAWQHALLRLFGFDLEAEPRDPL